MRLLECSCTLPLPSSLDFINLGVQDSGKRNQFINHSNLPEMSEAQANELLDKAKNIEHVSYHGHQL